MSARTQPTNATSRGGANSEKRRNFEKNRAEQKRDAAARKSLRERARRSPTHVDSCARRSHDGSKRRARRSARRQSPLRRTVSVASERRGRRFRGETADADGPRRRRLDDIAVAARRAHKQRRTPLQAARFQHAVVVKRRERALHFRCQSSSSTADQIRKRCGCHKSHGNKSFLFERQERSRGRCGRTFSQTTTKNECQCLKVLVWATLTLNYLCGLIFIPVHRWSHSRRAS